MINEENEYFEKIYDLSKIEEYILAQYFTNKPSLKELEKKYNIKHEEISFYDKNIPID